MIHIAICDDDSVQIKKTEALIWKAAAGFSPETDLFSDGEELIRAVEHSDYAPDLAVLDIHMPKSNGIDVAKALNRLVPECRIIFLTNFLGYATEVYETRHSYFLLKSELADRIDAALARALEDRSRDLRLSFREGRAIKTVPMAEVLYLERNLKKTFIALRSGQKHCTSLKAAELLKNTEPGQFILCHQSFWVNMEKVTGMTAGGFVLENGEEIPISRSRKKDAKEAFFARLKRQMQHT